MISKHELSDPVTVVSLGGDRGTDASTGTARQCPTVANTPMQHLQVLSASTGEGALVVHYRVYRPESLFSSTMTLLARTLDVAALASHAQEVLFASFSALLNSFLPSFLFFSFLFFSLAPLNMDSGRVLSIPLRFLLRPRFYTNSVAFTLPWVPFIRNPGPFR